MKKIINLTFIIVAFFIMSCDSDNELREKDSIPSEVNSLAEKYADSKKTSGGQGNPGGEAGVVTAGEWNDLKNWDFWNSLLNSKAYAEKKDYWKFYTNNRVAVLLKRGGKPVVNAKVELFKNNNLKWTARTDNFGEAELWIALYQQNSGVNIKDYTLSVNGQKIAYKLNFFNQKVNEIEINSSSVLSNKVQLAFIVDATGSMGDELEFLKEDLKDVIQEVGKANSALNIYTASVFYRDEGDDYVIKKSNFTDNLNVTLDFINKQRAEGGGDFPEAVHTALNEGVEKLNWSDNAKTRIAFLLLDAPPHYTEPIISDLQKTIKQAAEKGIKLIPITASGIDKETEFLMRFFSIATNGTYVFITNNSGVGNNHLEASVGEYQVEKLNDLMARLIKKYTE